jgi:hypothetical protein
MATKVASASQPRRSLAELRTRAGEAGWTPDLTLFAVLLVLTASFDKHFSKLGLPGGTIYVSELAFAAIAVLALRRVGVSGAVSRIRGSVPLLWLGALWLAGVIASARGLATFGLHAITHDVGLVEYSLVIPLVAVLVDSRRRADLLARTLVVAGICAAVTFAAGFFFLRGTWLNPGLLVLSAVTMYLSTVVLFPVARLLFLGSARTVALVGAGAACVLTALTVVRGAFVALLMAAIVLILLAPRRRRAFAVLVGAIAVSSGVALAIEAANVGWKPELVGAATVSAAPGFVAADDVSPFVGGRVVAGNAASGRYSREIKRGSWIQVNVGNLRPGALYELSFAAEPESPKQSAGFVGNTGGGGWGAKRWSVGPTVRWYRVHELLRATASSESLTLWDVVGADKIRVDAIRLVDLAGRSTQGLFQPTNITGDAGGSLPIASIPIWDDVRNVFDRNRQDSSGANAFWRLAYWRFLVEQTLKEPVFGVGFGKPAHFRWRGILYDARRGNAADPNDITPPHNSFLNVFYRMGLAGLVPLLLLVGLGLRGAVSTIRRPATGRSDQALLAGFVAVFVFAAFIAFFNVALENPYMGLFFWTPLAMLFVLPKLIGPAATGFARREAEAGTPPGA